MAFSSQMLTMLLVAMLIGGHSPQDQISKLTTNDLARGKKLFVAHCALCHGIGGTGGRGPSLNQPDLRRAAESRALIQIIQNGIEGTEMPEAWQMTDREIRQVAGYVRSLGRIAVVKVPGDPVKGKQYYEAKGGCTACHIVSGRGGTMGPNLTDIGARRSAAYLREALIDPGASVPEGFLVVSIVARDGQKVRGIRSNEDSFTIQLRDASNVFHSFRKLDLAELKKEFGASMMPGYRDVLAASEIDDLVAYLAGLRGEK
jgi:putative heme-binding domain-containing protein